jgi:hypothetical protein
MRHLLTAILLLTLAVAARAQDLPQETLRFTAPKKRALVIGAQEYTSLGKLRFAGKDAIAFANALRTDLGFGENEITLLSDADAKTKAPTSANIVSALDQLLADPALDSGDLFVFYFSGHGVGLNGGDYLAPTDASYEKISQQGLSVASIVSRIVAKGLKNVLFIADACRAGEKNPFGAELQQLGKKANIAVFLSCAPGKRSYELAGAESGAFTHALIDRLHNASADVLGVVWASNLARETSKQTFQLTEPSYGKYAQQPAAWSFENQDIVLAQTPRPELLAKIQKAADVSAELRKLGGTKAQFQEVLTAFSYQCVQEGQWSWALKFLRIVDQTSGLSNRDLLVFGILNYLTGDVGESKKVFARALAIKEPYFHALAVALDPLQSSSAKQRSEASEVIYNAERKFTYAEAAFVFAPTASDKESLIARQLRASGNESKEGLYWRARQAQLKNDLKLAKQLFLKSASMQGDPDATHYACVQLVTIAKASFDVEGQLAAWTLGMSIKGRQVYWALDMAEFMRDLDRTRTIQALQKYIDPQFSPKPADILEAVKIAGLSASELEPTLEKFATIYPYSPEYQTARWISKLLAKPHQFFDIPEEVWRVADDPVEARYDAFFTLWVALNEQESFPLLNKLAYTTEFMSSLLPFQDRFGEKPYVWREMVEWGVYSNRQYATYMMAKKYIYPKVLAGKADEELASTALKLAMNAGKDGDAEAIFKAYKWTAIQEEVPLRYAAYLVVRGKVSQARAIYQKLKRNDRSRGYFELYDGLGFFFKLSDKKTDELVKQFEAWDPGNVVGIDIKAFVGGKFFHDIKHFNAMSVAVDYYLAEFWYLSAACLEQMQKTLLTATFGKADENDQTRMGWVWLQAGYVGLEFTREASYAKNPSLEPFVGEYSYSYSYIWDPQREKGNQAGELKFTIATDGALTGTVKLGSKSLVMTGKCDAFGNLEAVSADGWTLLAKIPPKSLLGSIDMLKKYDQQFSLIDPQFGKVVGSAVPQ